MTIELGLIASASLIVLVVAAIAALLSSLLFPAARTRMDRLSPSTRANVLWLWAALPLLLGLAAVFMVLLPSIAYLLGIAADHCLEHGHHGHLCLVHSPLLAANAFELVIIAAAMMAVCARIGAIAAPLLRGNRALAMLLSMSEQTDEPAGYRLLSSRRFFAFTAGLLHPRVYISSRLSEELDPGELQAVLLHESAHRLRQDGLRKLSAQLLSCAHLPAMRRQLMDELGLAIEQSCDEYAAQSLSDRLTVAGTIVKLTRLCSLPRVCENAVSAFNASDPERRVVNLLNPPIPRPRFLSLVGGAFLLALSISGLVTAEFWHHVAESLFGMHPG